MYEKKITLKKEKLKEKNILKIWFIKHLKILRIK